MTPDEMFDEWWTEYGAKTVWQTNNVKGFVRIAFLAALELKHDPLVYYDPAKGIPVPIGEPSERVKLLGLMTATMFSGSSGKLHFGIYVNDAINLLSEIERRETKQ